MLKVIFFLSLASYGASQKREGDACILEYTYSAGRCARADKCRSAIVDFQQNGIKPTFCDLTFDVSALVCCRDGANILQTPPPAPVDTRPIWSSDTSIRQEETKQDKRRVSERKCDVYSESVTSTVNFISLIPQPERMTISKPKCSYTGVELIVGGEKARLGEFPHMAAIGWANYEGGYSFNCGGSLISRRFVLTAGHCTKDPASQPKTPVVVRLGDQNLDPAEDDGAKPVEIPIKHIHKHPDYKPPVKYNDIALLELATDVDFEDKIRPACLWTQDHFGDNTVAYATGWGVTSPDKPLKSNELLKVSLSLFDNNQCEPLLAPMWNRKWKGFVPSQVCAGELRGGKDTCQGDSGSPLQVASKENQCIFRVIGIVSFGGKCAQTGQPSVYTRVSSYLDWIEQVVWPGE